jgi:hypothetical protein
MPGCKLKKRKTTGEIKSGMPSQDGTGIVRSSRNKIRWK